MKSKITEWICDFVKNYAEATGINIGWGEPIVGFADAYSPYIQNLPEIISRTHILPQQVISDAKIVIAYYVPFTKSLADMNNTDTQYASKEWADAYEQTNKMFTKLNKHIIDKIIKSGGDAAVPDAAGSYDHDKLISDWSFRHFAYAAGLGTFGINNMLITARGCCGRYNVIVTNLKLESDKPQDGELCLYKKNKSCGICIKHCPAQALTADKYDRHKCYAVLSKNAQKYTHMGNSYQGSTGSEVCGKCITQSPCAFWEV